MSATKPVRRKIWSVPGHFICADRCEWFAHEDVGRYCVSSVGELRLNPGEPLTTVGFDRYYETMVFDRRLRRERWQELKMWGCNTRAEAVENHREALRWAMAKCAGGAK